MALGLPNGSFQAPIIAGWERVLSRRSEDALRAIFAQVREYIYFTLGPHPNQASCPWPARSCLRTPTRTQKSREASNQVNCLWNGGWFQQKAATHQEVEEQWKRGGRGSSYFPFFFPSLPDEETNQIQSIRKTKLVKQMLSVRRFGKKEKCLSLHSGQAVRTAPRRCILLWRGQQSLRCAAALRWVCVCVRPARPYFVCFGLCLFWQVCKDLHRKGKKELQRKAPLVFILYVYSYRSFHLRYANDVSLARGSFLKARWRKEKLKVHLKWCPGGIVIEHCNVLHCIALHEMPSL